MHPRVRIFGIIFACLFWLVVIFAICGCIDTSTCGRVAAHECGMQKYLAFERNGKPDSAAVIPFRGKWWVYHPSMLAQMTLVETDQEPQLWMASFVKGATNPRFEWTGNPAPQYLPNGCLPNAILSHRIHGGRLVIDGTHIRNVY